MLRHFFKSLKGHQTKFNLFSKAECIIMNVIMTMLYIEIWHISIFVLFTSSKFLFMCYFLYCLDGAIIVSIPSMNLALCNILFYLFFNILMHLYNIFFFIFNPIAFFHFSLFPHLIKPSSSQSSCHCVYMSHWVWLGFPAWAWVGSFLLVSRQLDTGYTSGENDTLSSSIHKQPTVP